MGIYEFSYDSILGNSLHSNLIMHFFHLLSHYPGTMGSREILLMGATLSRTAYLVYQVLIGQGCKFRIASYDIAVPAG